MLVTAAAEGDDPVAGGDAVVVASGVEPAGAAAGVSAAGLLVVSAMLSNHGYLYKETV